MKKLLAGALFLSAATLFGQAAQRKDDVTVRKDGGPIVVVTSVTAVYDEGVLAAPMQSALNCVGAGIACTVDAVNGWIIVTVGGGGGGAPDTVDYLIGTVDAGLANGIVVGVTPGGELGGTWASPTLDDGLTVVNWTSINTDTSFNAKGDMMIGTANNAASAHTAGANDTIPMYDSSQADGVKNQAPATTEIADTGTAESAGTSDTWARGDHVHMTGFMEPTKFIEQCDEFFGLPATGVTSFGQYTGIVVTNTGTGAAASRANGEAERQGIGTMDTGTTTTGACSARGSSAISIAINGYEFFKFGVRFPVLSDGTETYLARFGIGDGSAAGGAPTDGIYFVYDSTASANWQIAAKGAGTETLTTTSIAVADNLFQDLYWQVSTDGTSVEYFIDGVSAGTIATANVPTVTEVTTLAWSIVKSAGTTARLMHVDYYCFGDTVAR